MFAMNKLLLFILLFTCCTHYQMFGSCSNTLVRKERNLLNMAGSLLCSKNRLHVSLLGLTQYGCFCGPGGSGKPVDEVDQCCLAHDCCYGHAQVNLKCPTKLSPYQFVCEKETVKCLSTNFCSRAACECDRLFVECLTNSQQGQSKYHFYDKKKLCPSPDAACPPIPPSMSLAKLQAATKAKRQTKRKAARG